MVESAQSPSIRSHCYKMRRAVYLDEIFPYQGRATVITAAPVDSDQEPSNIS